MQELTQRVALITRWQSWEQMNFALTLAEPAKVGEVICYLYKLIHHCESKPSSWYTRLTAGRMHSTWKARHLKPLIDLPQVVDW